MTMLKTFNHSIKFIYGSGSIDKRPPRVWTYPSEFCPDEVPQRLFNVEQKGTEGAILLLIQPFPIDLIKLSQIKHFLRFKCLDSVKLGDKKPIECIHVISWLFIYP